MNFKRKEKIVIGRKKAGWHELKRYMITGERERERERERGETRQQFISAGLRPLEIKGGEEKKSYIIISNIHNMYGQNNNLIQKNQAVIQLLRGERDMVYCEGHRPIHKGGGRGRETVALSQVEYKIQCKIWTGKLIFSVFLKLASIHNEAKTKTAREKKKEMNE